MRIDLCHKCAGYVDSDDATAPDDVKGLNPCECISTGGGVHAATTDEAATKQVDAALRRLRLYSTQKRRPSDINYANAYGRFLNAVRVLTRNVKEIEP